MGVKIHGPCDGCHRQRDLVIEERYCSEACVKRAADSELWGQGFVSGAVIALIIGALIWWFVPRRQPPTDIEQLEAKRAMAEMIQAMTDAASIQISNGLQRARAARELEKR